MIGNVSNLLQHCSNFHTPKILKLRTTGPRLERILDRKVPGPGAYRAPSDFGWVEPIKLRNLSMMSQTMASNMASSRVTPQPTRMQALRAAARDTQSMLAKPKTRNISSANSPVDPTRSTKATTALPSRNGYQTY